MATRSDSCLVIVPSILSRVGRRARCAIRSSNDQRIQCRRSLSLGVDHQRIDVDLGQLVHSLHQSANGHDHLRDRLDVRPAARRGNRRAAWPCVASATPRRSALRPRRPAEASRRPAPRPRCRPDRRARRYPHSDRAWRPPSARPFGDIFSTRAPSSVTPGAARLMFLTNVPGGAHRASSARLR